MGLPLVTRPPPLPGSSTSILDSLGVFDPSPSESLAPLATSARAGGGWKFSIVRPNVSPPLAVSFSRIETGGGSWPCMVLISYALEDISMVS